MSDKIETVEAEKKPRGQGIGKLAVDLIRAGKTNAEVLEALKTAHPTARTTMSSVNWYRNNLRSKGESVPPARAPKALKLPPIEG